MTTVIDALEDRVTTYQLTRREVVYLHLMAWWIRRGMPRWFQPLLTLCYQITYPSRRVRAENHRTWNEAIEQAGREQCTEFNREHG